MGKLEFKGDVTMAPFYPGSRSLLTQTAAAVQI